MSHISRPIVHAISGASGALYAARLLDVLLAADREVQLVISPAGQAVFKTELALEVNLAAETFDTREFVDNLRQRLTEFGFSPAAAHLPSAPPHSPRLTYYHYQNLFAPLASGSARTAGMVICPCSGGSVSAIAHASSTNLIHRAADVHLKERRKLILVPRETPLSTIQLENLRRAAEAGAVVLPAMPGFYHGARTLADLVDFVVARIADQLDVPHHLTRRWGEAADG